MQRPAAVLFVCALVLAPTFAFADPITPAQDKPGAVLRYQRLGPEDRQATLEAFTGAKISNLGAFDSLDACTLRETTEDDASRAKLGKTIADCQKELGK
ncbi:hypothetical protein [Roseixanthobacter pseudopolyaromaticivorans]|uniref:hypothetical protein n=1 Tax=Xanthobacteraceae TaxID=335928 RepID=UPI00372B40B1